MGIKTQIDWHSNVWKVLKQGSLIRPLSFKINSNETHFDFSDLCLARTCLVNLSKSLEYCASTSALFLKKSCNSYKIEIWVSSLCSKHLIPSLSCDFKSFNKNKKIWLIILLKHIVSNWN